MSNPARAVAAVGNDFFDWLGEVNNPNPPPYVTAPTLDDSTASQVAAFLATQQSAGKTLAVKIRAGVVLSPTTVQTIFNGFNVKYTFVDYEGANTITMDQALRAELTGTQTGNAIAANSSYIGNFQVATIPTDPTHPNSVTYTSGNSNAEPYFTTTDFRNSGMNMSNESLYPGDASFRNPIFGTSTAASGSNAPNLRSALFTLPITRMSIVSANIGNSPHIPYVARFNNEDNAPFTNATFNGQHAFDTTGPAINGVPVAGQLISRDDFEALILHYRMRGATSYHLLDPGVVNYTQAQEEQDAQAGWNESLVSAVMAGTNGRPATLGATITVDGSLKTFENAGVAYSAVTNDDATGTQLAILVSNMDGTGHTVSFNTRINGATLTFTSGVLGAGTHTVLRFTKSGGLWNNTNTDAVFNDTGAMASRDGIGIPEPTCLSLLGLGAFGILGRRRRTA